VLQLNFCIKRYQFYIIEDICACKNDQWFYDILCKTETYEL